MLVLQRKLSERVRLIGPDHMTATVTVISIDGNAVRLGIEAPPVVRVRRDDPIKRCDLCLSVDDLTAVGTCAPCLRVLDEDTARTLRAGTRHGIRQAMPLAMPRRVAR
jgi:carbon storage regulator CsrA